MANDTLQILDVATGKVVVREITEAEKAQRNSEIAEWEIANAERIQKIETSWQTKVSAFLKLGLNAEEIEELAPTPSWLKPNGTLD